MIMTMTNTETISSDWQCHALEPRGDVHGHRCEAGGVRYRDGQWVCARHFDELASRYVGGLKVDL
jgi:hypothetical protein